MKILFLFIFLNCSEVNSKNGINLAFTNFLSRFTSNTSIPTYTLGGNITGLTSSGLILLSGTSPNQTLTVSSGSSTFQFPTPISSGTNYSVTVSQQPTNLICNVSNGSGIITANISNVTVNCIPLEQVATPTFNPTAGYYATPQPNIQISTTTSGATIYYTLDGSTPTTSSTIYTTGLGHIYSLAGLTIKAIATKNGMIDSEVATAEYSYPPIQTGQTLCHDSGGTIISGCVGATGHDGLVQAGGARSYTDNPDGTVTDNYSGLVWQKCSRGQSVPTCSGGSTTTWDDAITHCTALNTPGKTWRVPTLYELLILADYNANSSPIINGTLFPNTITATTYWSSTTNTQNTLEAWTLDFSNAGTSKTNKGNLRNLRCVSGAIQSYLSKYIDNGDGTVLDRKTNLTWQKCSRGRFDTTCSSGMPTQADWNTNGAV